LDCLHAEGETICTYNIVVHRAALYHRRGYLRLVGVDAALRREELQGVDVLWGVKPVVCTDAKSGESGMATLIVDCSS
jgi:hypothetical protein